MLIIDDWEQLQSIIAENFEFEAKEIRLTMYGLFQRSVGTRYATSQPDIHSIRASVFEAWNGDTTAFLHLVRPQEHLGLREIHLIIEFSNLVVPLPRGDLPVLKRLTWHFSDPVVDTVASYHTPNLTPLRLLVQCGLSEWCGPDLRTTCNLHVEKRVMIPLSPVALQTGSLVEIYIHMGEIEAEEVSTIQTILQPAVIKSDGQEDNSDLDTPGPQVTCFRPNQEIQLPFDEDLPHIRTTPTGPTIVGRIIPPPQWNTLPIYRAALSSGAIFRGGDGHLVVRIRSWYISHEGPVVNRPRDFAMRPQLLVRLHEALRRTWQDLLPGHETITIRAVRPSPTDQTDEQGVRRFHVLAEIQRPVRTDRQPILISLREISSEGVAQPTWCPTLLPTRFTTQDILNNCDFRIPIFQLLAPLGGAVRRWMSPYHERVATAGLFLPCWYDRRLRPMRSEPYEVDEEDATHLMQRSVSRSPRRDTNTPSSVGSSMTANLAHVFHMAAEHRLIVFDRRAPLSYFSQLNDIWQHPPHVHALALHEVHSPPPDLTSNADSTFILELSPDCNRRAMPTDVLILLDIVIANLDATGDPTHLRRVVWSRRMMSRQGILYLASSSAFCDLPEVQCEVQINRQTWSEDDHAQRQVLHGDFVKLSISGPREMSTSDVQVILCEQEAADIQRYIFRRSPSRSSTSQDSDGAASGSVPSGDDLSTDTDEQENADTHELLYQPLQLSGKPSQSVPLVDITNLQSLQQQTPKESICETGPQQTPLTLRPLTEPHVSDRWCALQEGQGVPIEPAELTMSPVKLSLEKLIPNDEKPSYGQVSVSLPGLPDFAERICSFNTYLCSEVPAPHEVTQDHVDLIADWARAIAFAQHNEGNDPIQIAIYTDGSKLWNDAIIEETSGWSYVVTAKWAHSDEWGIIGHNSAAINVDKETSYWLGATAHQSYQAETEALVRALLWLCQGDCYISTICIGWLLFSSTSSLFQGSSTSLQICWQSCSLGSAMAKSTQWTDFQRVCRSSCASCSWSHSLSFSGLTDTSWQRTTALGMVVVLWWCSQYLSWTSRCWSPWFCATSTTDNVVQGLCRSVSSDMWQDTHRPPDDDMQCQLFQRSFQNRATIVDRKSRNATTTSNWIRITLPGMAGDSKTLYRCLVLKALHWDRSCIKWGQRRNSPLVQTGYPFCLHDNREWQNIDLLQAHRPHSPSCASWNLDRQVSWRKLESHLHIRSCTQWTDWPKREGCFLDEIGSVPCSVCRLANHCRDGCKCKNWQWRDGWDRYFRRRFAQRQWSSISPISPATQTLCTINFWTLCSSTGYGTGDLVVKRWMETHWLCAIPATMASSSSICYVDPSCRKGRWQGRPQSGMWALPVGCASYQDYFPILTSPKTPHWYESLDFEGGQTTMQRNFARHGHGTSRFCGTSWWTSQLFAWNSTSSITPQVSTQTTKWQTLLDHRSNLGDNWAIQGNPEEASTTTIDVDQWNASWDFWRLEKPITR